MVFAIVFVFDISAYNCNRNEIQYMYLTPCLTCTCISIGICTCNIVTVRSKAPQGCTLLMYTWQIKGNYIHEVEHLVNDIHGVGHRVNDIHEAKITIFIVGARTH